MTDGERERKVCGYLVVPKAEWGTEYVLWHIYSDKDHEVGPFYFCSEGCRDRWLVERKAKEPNLVDGRTVVQPAGEEDGCDMAPFCPSQPRLLKVVPK